MNVLPKTSGSPPSSVSHFSLFGFVLVIFRCASPMSAASESLHTKQSHPQISASKKPSLKKLFIAHWYHGINCTCLFRGFASKYRNCNHCLRPSVIVCLTLTLTLRPVVHLLVQLNEEENVMSENLCQTNIPGFKVDLLLHVFGLTRTKHIENAP